MAEGDHSDVASYLADHPRMMGVLFTLCLLLSKGTTAATAAGGSGSAGP